MKFFFRFGQKVFEEIWKYRERKKTINKRFMNEMNIVKPTKKKEKKNAFEYTYN
jgi:hypothetical protein